MRHTRENFDTEWVPDGGAGWAIVYLAGSLPIGVVLLGTSTWGPAAGVALITWPWWATWVRAVKR